MFVLFSCLFVDVNRQSQNVVIASFGKMKKVGVLVVRAAAKSWKDTGIFQKVSRGLLIEILAETIVLNRKWR